MSPIYVIESGVRARTATAQRKLMEQFLVTGIIGVYSEVPVKINGLIIALGLMTEKTIEQGKSVSVHGQVLTGQWGAFTIAVFDQ
jgi:hypothetical protein